MPRIPLSSLRPPPESHLFFLHELQALAESLKAGRREPVRLRPDLALYDEKSEASYLAAKLAGIDELEVVIVE